LVAIYAPVPPKSKGNKKPTDGIMLPNVGAKVKKGGVIYLLRSSYA
jgi:hypothetical protein